MKTILDEPRMQSRKKNAERILSSSAADPSIKIKSILVAVDFSEPAMLAFDYAKGLGQRLDAEIQLAHIETPDETAAPGTAHLVRESAESATLLHQKLAQLEPEAAPRSWPENCHIRSGHPYKQICDLAAELNVDLIVVGSRGHAGFKRIVLGSTAERVVRFAPCPVLVVRKSRKTDSSIREILVPTDFSQCAMIAANYGARLAKQLGARLRLLNVVFPAAPVLVERVAVNLPIDNALEMREARLEMQALSELDLFGSINHEATVRSGYVTDTICGEMAKADLVVISTHGRTGLRHALLGSVAEHVVRHAECPVLVVPSRYAST